MKAGTRTAVLVVGAALSLLPGLASAGHYYEAVTVTDSDQNRMDSEMTIKAWVDGDSTRIEFAEGDQTGFFGPGSYMVTTDAGENLYLVDPEEQTYAEFNLGEMMNTAGAMMEGMGDMFKIEFTDLSSEKISEGPGESILGYSTRHLQYRTGYTMRMAVMGMKQEQRVDMTQDMWVTDAFDPRAFAVWLRPDQRMKGFIEGLDELMEAEFSKMQGVPLKSVMVQTSTDKKGRTSTSTTTTEVQALREESIPASMFQIPAGYTETEVLPEMAELEAMQQGQDQEAQDDEQRKRPRLRDLFGRGDG